MSGEAFTPDEMLRIIREQEKRIKEQQKEIEKYRRSVLGNIRDSKAVKENYTAFDTVFTHLFGDVHYTLQLYRTLHPEDTKVVEDDITLMTIESYLVNQQYNDLGFLVNDRLIILVEHQSTWSDNIILRALMYVVETWLKYIKLLKLNIYGKKRVVLPKPELYVIYTGEKTDNMPEELTLRKDFFNDPDVCVDCRVKIIYSSNKGDIIDQFLTFSEVLKEQNRIYGKTEKAVLETIRICIGRNVLKEFLEQQKREIVDIMLALYDYDDIMESHDNEVWQEGQQDALTASIRNVMKSLNCPVDRAMDIIMIPQEQREMYTELVENSL